MKRRAVVMGGAGGIGSSICRLLGLAGHQVIIADLNRGGAETVAEGLAREGLDVIAEGCDASVREQVEGLRDRREVDGGIDILVNLAGVVRNDLVVKVKDEDFNLTIATHLNSTLNGLRAFLPGMRKRGYGRVVTMSSVAARGSVGGASYSSAKAGIEGLTRTAAIEMAKSGVTVNCIAPGLIDAGMYRTVPVDYQESSLKAVPMARAGEPREVAACVCFLTSEDASYVTGQTLYVCGGLSIGPL
jgi:3-oxoacyl-[acyl-carrier protein] reductase